MLKGDKYYGKIKMGDTIKKKKKEKWWWELQCAVWNTVAD